MFYLAVTVSWCLNGLLSRDFLFSVFAGLNGVMSRYWYYLGREGYVVDEYSWCI